MTFDFNKANEEYTYKGKRFKVIDRDSNQELLITKIGDLYVLEDDDFMSEAVSSKVLADFLSGDPKATITLISK